MASNVLLAIQILLVNHEHQRVHQTLPQDITESQLACCEYLERNGLRFMIDFGYQNAEERVWAMLETDVTLEFGKPN